MLEPRTNKTGDGCGAQPANRNLSFPGRWPISISRNLKSQSCFSWRGHRAGGSIARKRRKSPGYNTLRASASVPLALNKWQHVLWVEKTSPSDLRFAVGSIPFLDHKQNAVGSAVECF